MPILTETARAKVNLTLEVIGKRGDGYHELRSLVAFADVSDALTLEKLFQEDAAEDVKAAAIDVRQREAQGARK